MTGRALARLVTACVGFVRAMRDPPAWLTPDDRADLALLAYHYRMPAALALGLQVWEVENLLAALPEDDDG